MIIINSFPRTGNRNLLVYMRFMFKIEKLSKNQKIFHNKELLSDSSIKQIVILRHPRDTIISFCVLRGQLPYNKKSNLDQSIFEWIEYHEKILKNINHLYPLFFEQTITNPVECLIKLSEIFSIPRVDDYISQRFFLDPVRKEKSKATTVQVSSKISGEYYDFEQEYELLNPKTHKRLNELYEELSVAFIKRQAQIDRVV